MIASDTDGPEAILSMKTHFTNRQFDSRTLSLIEANRPVCELFDFCLLQTWPRWNAQHSRYHAKAAPIRSSFVSMQPCAVTPEGNQVTQRKLVVIEISHGRIKIRALPHGRAIAPFAHPNNSILDCSSMQRFVQTRRCDMRGNNQIPIMEGLLDIRERLAERGTSPTVREGSVQ